MQEFIEIRDDMINDPVFSSLEPEMVGRWSYLLFLSGPSGVLPTKLRGFGGLVPDSGISDAEAVETLHKMADAGLLVHSPDTGTWRVAPHPCIRLASDT